MSCQNKDCGQNTTPRTFNYVTLIVLYILLAIIIGSCIW